MSYAIVTGASAGIGKEIAIQLAERGHDIILTARRENRLQELASEIRSRYQVNVDYITADLAEVDAPDQIHEFCKNNNYDVEILINNAGINLDNLSIRLTEENWKKVIDINLTSTFLMCKFAIKKMLKKKYGKIINITSIVGHTGNLGQANYSASKGGIVAFSKSLAIEYA